MPHRCATWFALAGLLCTLTVGNAAAQESLTVGAQDDGEGTDILGAFGDSFKLLLIEHAWRIGLQEKTRADLGGKFWLDYQRSVRMPRQWGDTDAGWVNYLGHPIHGAAAGYIWLDHDPSAPGEFSLTRRYWTSRSRAMAFSAVYSLQFEIGPLSEASIGNVGMDPKTTGWVDHAVTPVAGLGLMIAEDALDQFFLRWVEKRVRNRVYRASLRMIFNPGRTLGNLSTNQAPWYRKSRPLTPR